MEAMPRTWRAPQVTMSLWRSLIFFESRMTPAIWKTVGVAHQHCTVAPGCGGRCETCGAMTRVLTQNGQERLDDRGETAGADGEDWGGVSGRTIAGSKFGSEFGSHLHRAT
jgi:hypothetical protein